MSAGASPVAPLGIICTRGGDEKGARRVFGGAAGMYCDAESLS